MARVLIELPAQFVFSTEVPIYITHINKAQHLDNAALIAERTLRRVCPGV